MAQTNFNDILAFVAVARAGGFIGRHPSPAFTLLLDTLRYPWL
jgi:hypothetical protein